MNRKPELGVLVEEKGELSEQKGDAEISKTFIWSGVNDAEWGKYATERKRKQRGRKGGTVKKCGTDSNVRDRV